MQEQETEEITKFLCAILFLQQALFPAHLIGITVSKSNFHYIFQCMQCTFEWIAMVSKQTGSKGRNQSVAFINHSSLGWGRHPGRWKQLYLTLITEWVTRTQTLLFKIIKMCFRGDKWLPKSEQNTHCSVSSKTLVIEEKDSYPCSSPRREGAGE